ncbi:hypothetical protein ZOSMA_8G01860 [Zostera marina]|uniref:GPI-anchored protein LLG1-like domain-containing protein n=1 Tax=Zostera marina TaxID=29655 RepID=A0A0K9NLR5_ZOSMR|nr:hypothetical protein ZOSMA_8G01860 [Zostera marina]
MYCCTATRFLQLALLFFVTTSVVSADDDLIDFSSCGNGGRHLLQEKKPCSVNFEMMNYTNILTQCKAPRYSREKCCPAFKQLICPYSDEINDLTTNCASTMYSYLNAKGPYPAGFFANSCTDIKEGMDCTGYQNTSDQTSAASPLSTFPHGFFLGFMLFHTYVDYDLLIK